MELVGLSVFAWLGGGFTFVLLYVLLFWLVMAARGKGFQKGEDGRIVIYAPEIIYHWIQYIAYPINLCINQAVYWQTAPKKWDDADGAKETCELRLLRKDVLDDSLNTFAEADIIQLYDSLPAITPEEMVGHSYKGRIIRTGSTLDVVDKLIAQPLTGVGFRWGKRFRSKHVGDPLLLSYKNKIFIPIPMWGSVGMCSVRWRGDNTSTMNYDHQPWKDYFKLLSDPEDPVKVYLGSWTSRDMTGGWFTLTVDKDTPTLPVA